MSEEQSREQSRKKRLLVGDFDCVIDDREDIERITGEIESALRDGGLVIVPVLDKEGNRQTLYLHGGRVDALVLDLGEGPRPGEIWP